jgi:hypothetical protein
LDTLEKVRASIEEVARNFHLVMIAEDFPASLVLLRWVPTVLKVNR